MPETPTVSDQEQIVKLLDKGADFNVRSRHYATELY